jgi:hypothetical protein
MKNIQTKVVEKIETHISCLQKSPPPKKKATYEIMWNKQGRPQMTI